MGDPNNYKKFLHPWIPMKDPVQLACLSKHLEELGECAQATARCVMQGIDGKEEETGVINKVWLQDEVADVWATINWLVETFDLDRDAMIKRYLAKTEHFRGWQALIEEQSNGSASEGHHPRVGAERPPNTPGDGEQAD